MALRILIESSGEEAVERDLLGLADRAEDARPVLRRVAEMMRLAEIAWFDSEGEGSWPALAESTVLAKDSGGLPPEMLVASGELRDSLTKEGGANIEFITLNELIFGTEDPVAGFHQKGTRNMPARPPLHFSELVQRAFTRELQAWLVGSDQAAVGAAGAAGNIF